MTQSPADLAARLAAEGRAVQEFFQTLDLHAWSSPVYHEGDVWQVRQMLAHFTASERGFQTLIQDVSEGGPGAAEDFDIQAFNHLVVTDTIARDPLVLLAQFAMVRERTVAIVSSLREEQLDMTGRHPYLGIVPLGDMIRAIYHHNNLHLRDVRSALRASGIGGFVLKEAAE
jgi:hypothetical protein